MAFIFPYQYVGSSVLETVGVMVTKTVLVTGGAGFLGSWLCDILVAKNAKVYCIDNLSSGRAANIKHLLPNKSFVFKKHDNLSM